MKKLAYVLGACFAFAITQPLSASIVTYSTENTGPNFNFSPNIGLLPGFDSTLGTLTSVLIHTDWAVTAGYGLETGSPPPSGGIWNPQIQIGAASSTVPDEFNPPHLTDIELTATGNGDVQAILESTANNVDEYSILGHASSKINLQSPSELSYFSSTKALLAVGAFYTGPIYLGRYAQSDVTVQLAYTYTPASTVPEPGTWAMIALGVGLVGWSARRRSKPIQADKRSECAEQSLA